MNHWNFLSSKDDKIHCETTTDVDNNTMVSLGQWDNKLGKYTIIMSELSPKYIREKEKYDNRRKFLKDPLLIKLKKDLKKLIDTGKVKASFSVKDTIAILRNTMVKLLKRIKI